MALSNQLRRARTHSPGLTPFAQPRRLPGRHPLASSFLGLCVVAALVATVLVIWRPWRQCGRGLTAVGSPHICVGLNLDGTPFQDQDPLADLTSQIVAENKAITGFYATVVLMTNMTPDQDVDSSNVKSLRHDIEGTLTAVRRANGSTVAGDPIRPKIRLLLANMGSNGVYGGKATDAIRYAAVEQHIVAVTGIGVSQKDTRAAIAALGEAPSIAVVGSVVTADDMNTAPDGDQLRNFARVAPTNSDEVRGAASYIQKIRHDDILLIKDTNPEDSYAQTLAVAFEKLSKIRAAFTEYYQSPRKQDAVRPQNRSQFLAGQFDRMHSDICSDKPDLIYFAGRGVDLASFLTAQAQAGHCGLQAAPVVTGDDASNLAGEKLDYSDVVNDVVFTGLAFPSVARYIVLYATSRTTSVISVAPSSLSI